jgi:ferredoxin
MMYIQPDECINCGLCLSVCPVDAIFAEEDLPETERSYLAVNAEFFSAAVTGWGAPGGADARFRTKDDHPVVAASPKAQAASAIR